jgi:hypothetical protein
LQDDVRYFDSAPKNLVGIKSDKSNQDDAQDKGRDQQEYLGLNPETREQSVDVHISISAVWVNRCSVGYPSPVSTLLSMLVRSSIRPELPVQDRQA